MTKPGCFSPLAGGVALLLSIAAPWPLGYLVGTSRVSALAEERSYVADILAQANQLLAGQPRDAARAAKLFREAARAGSADAMLALADLYVRGDGVGKDPAAAELLLTQAVDAGAAAPANAALGDFYRTADPPYRDPAKALQAYQRSVQLGNTWAMIALARMVAAGDGVPADFDRARTLLEQAIAGGVAKEGWAELARLYSSDDPAHRDLAKAAEAYRKAADLGDPWSLIALAKMTSTGSGVPADFDQARILLQRAIASGAAKDGWAALAALYREAEPSHRDLGKAADAYQHAADLGDPWSMAALAQMVAAGDGIRPDFARAKILFEQAIGASAEVAKGAFVGLGDLYRTAEGGDRDPARAVDAYQGAVNLGNTTAMVSLARMLGQGDGVPVDFERARSLLEGAIAAGDTVDGWATLGGLYQHADPQHRDFAEAARAYRHAADLGDPWSMIALAKMTAAHQGVPADFEEARSLLENAIKAGVAREGWAALAELYANGEGSHRDLSKAADAYERAADLGEPWSTLALARMLASGKDIPKDIGRARSLFESAAAADSEAAKSAWAGLGDLLSTAKGADNDPKAAADAYQKAADLGNIAAMISLARMLGAGDGVPTDFDRAQALLDRALAGGAGADAWRARAELYRNADAGHRDLAKAADSFQKAVDLGDPWAMLALAQMLGSGDDAAQNFGRARALFQRSTAAGDEVAKYAYAGLGDLYRTATGDSRDPEKAAEAYAKAIDLGNSGAMVSLARMLGAGDGIPQNFDKARSLLEKAISVGAGADGWSALANLYQTKDPAYRDLAKSAEAYQKAADLGDPWSMINLARMLQKGDGVAVDFEGARALLEKAIAGGVTKEGWAALANLYRQADGNHRDLAKAADAYQHAADLGDPWSMIGLGQMLGAGEGIPANVDRAKALLDNAVAAGLVADGNMSLGDLFWHRFGGKKALVYYEKAAAAGNGYADLAAATIQSADLRIPRSRAAAVAHLHSAAAALGGEAVAKNMFTMGTRTLVTLVQEMLSDSGAKLAERNGLLGRSTQVAIESFCKERSISVCDPTIITVEFLATLVRSPLDGGASTTQ